MSEHVEAGKKLYLKYAGVLGILAVATLTMVFIGESGMSEAPKAVLLLIGSSIKASLIMFYFMHLRIEKMGLVMTVLVGIYATGILMFVIPAYDAGTVLERTLYP